MTPMPKLCAYVITLEDIEERASSAKSLIASLSKAKVFDEASVHPAIYWKDKPAIVDYLTRFPQHTFQESYLEDCLMGQLAVTLSHISAWRRLVESDCDAAVVFEDDVYVTDMPRFAEIIAHLRKDGSTDWVRLNLHKRYRDQILKSGRGQMFIDDPQPWGFAAYYLTKSAAQKLLMRCCKFEKPIDWYPPTLIKKKVLVGKSVTEVLVDHRPFTGTKSELRERARAEKRAEGLQDVASTIFTSPPVADDLELRRFLSRLNNLDELRKHGFTVLRGVFDRQTIEAARAQVLANRSLFRNTRPTPSAGHLAGFHRFPALESLHGLLTGDSRITGLIEMAVGGARISTIGLSDITINRSQPWHVDLLRGKYREFLDTSLIWGPEGGGLYKVLLYLNDSDSLRVVRRSHVERISLESDDHAEPADDAEITPVPVYVGNVVVMDLRCCHRGADEGAYASGQWDDDPRILVTTVFGAADRELTRAMEIGNFHRLMDWSERSPSDLQGQRAAHSV
jgi:GR25 family glycosyltransferase involved in LPS biosynthesis